MAVKPYFLFKRGKYPQDASGDLNDQAKLQEIVDNFNNSNMEFPFHIGHISWVSSPDDELSCGFGQDLRLTKSGQLYTDNYQLNDDTKIKIAKKQLKYSSVEFGGWATDDNPYYFRSCALLGRSTPGVPGTIIPFAAPVVQFFKEIGFSPNDVTLSEGKNGQPVITVSRSFKAAEWFHDPDELAHFSKYEPGKIFTFSNPSPNTGDDNNNSDNKEVNTMPNTNPDPANPGTHFSADDYVKLQQENAALKGQVTTFQQEDAARITAAVNSEAETFFSQQINDFRVPPAAKDKGVLIFTSYLQTPEARKDFQDFINAFGPQLDKTQFATKDKVSSQSDEKKTVYEKEADDIVAAVEA